MKEQTKTEALVKQNTDSPELVTVKNRDGKERLAARAKGRFVSVAQAQALATQKSVLKILKTTDETGKDLHSRVIESQLKVAEENTSAKNLGGVSKLLEHVDEISGAKAAREALAQDINQPIVPRVIYVPTMMYVKPMEERPTEKTRPSFAEVESVYTNPKE